MIYGITLIILGLLASPAILLNCKSDAKLLSNKKVDAKELLDKLVPYQGWAGLIFCFWGIWGIISCILNLNYLSLVPVWWITWLLCSLAQALLGFLLGYGLIVKYVLSKNEAAKEKGDQLLAKLQPLQGKIGIFGIIMGIWVIVCYILFYV